MQKYGPAPLSGEELHSSVIRIVYGYGLVLMVHSLSRGPIPYKRQVAMVEPLVNRMRCSSEKLRFAIHVFEITSYAVDPRFPVVASFGDTS